MRKNFNNNTGTSLHAARSRKARGRNQKALNDAITMETLETRQLMTVISVTDFGANGSNGSDSRAAFQAALNAAKPGDTVSVPAGTFDISGALNVPSGVTIAGLGSNSSHINFTLTDGDLYGFMLDGNDSNVTITGLDLHSTHGIVAAYYGSDYNNLTITNDALQFGGGASSNGTLVEGIYIPIANNNLQITHNYFHDSPNSNRDWEIWYSTGAQLNYNTLYNVNDGGHLEEPQNNCSFSYNYGTYLHRMGQEIQGYSASTGLKVIGNTFYDWVNPWYNSFGMSVANMYSYGTVIADNYIDANMAPGSSWGQADGSGVNRFGYAIEAGGYDLTVSNNTIVGNWAEGVSAMNPNVLVENNKTYGGAMWGNYVGEPGPNGVVGSVNNVNSTADANVGDAPTAPANTNNYTGGSTTPVSTPPVSTPPVSTPPVSTPPVSISPVSTTPVVTANGINGLVVTVLSDTSVKLTWTNASSLTDASISIISTVGRQQFGSISIADNSDSATIVGLHSGWQLDFEVTGKTSSGTAVNSAVVTAQTSGNPMATSTGTPTLLTPPTMVNPPTATPPAGTTPDGITGLTATVLGDNTIQLSWTTTATLTSAEVSIITTEGRQMFLPVTVDGDVSSITIGNLHAGWRFDFAVTGTATDGSTVSSGTVTAQTTGSYCVATAGNPTVLASTAVTPPATIVDSPATGTVGSVVATVLSDTSVQLSWVNTGTDQVSAEIGVITTVGRQLYPTISVNGSTTTATITGLHAGWQFDFTVMVTNSSGQVISSVPVTVLTTGSWAETTSPMSIAANSSLLAA